MPKTKKERAKHIYFLFHGVEDSIKTFIRAKKLSIFFFFKRRFNMFLSHFQSFKLKLFK